MKMDDEVKDRKLEITLFIWRFKKCGVTDAMLAQKENFERFGHSCTIQECKSAEIQILLNPISFLKPRKEQTENNVLISHDLKTDLMLCIHSIFFGRQKDKFHFSHSQFTNDFLNRKGIPKGILLIILQLIVYKFTKCDIIAPSVPHKDWIEKKIKSLGINKNVMLLMHTLKDAWVDGIKSTNTREYKTKPLKIILCDSVDKNKGIEQIFNLINYMASFRDDITCQYLGQSQGNKYENIKTYYLDSTKKIIEMYEESDIYISMSTSESFHYAAFYAFATDKTIILSKTKLHIWLNSFFRNTKVFYVNNANSLTQEIVEKAIDYTKGAVSTNDKARNKYKQLELYEKHVRENYETFLDSIIKKVCK